MGDADPLTHDASPSTPPRTPVLPRPARRGDGSGRPRGGALYFHAWCPAGLIGQRPSRRRTAGARCVSGHRNTAGSDRRNRADPRRGIFRGGRGAIDVERRFQNDGILRRLGAPDLGGRRRVQSQCRSESRALLVPVGHGRKSHTGCGQRLRCVSHLGHRAALDHRLGDGRRHVDRESRDRFHHHRCRRRRSDRRGGGLVGRGDTDRPRAHRSTTVADRHDRRRHRLPDSRLRRAATPRRRTNGISTARRSRARPALRSRSRTCSRLPSGVIMPSSRIRRGA